MREDNYSYNTNITDIISMIQTELQEDFKSGYSVVDIAHRSSLVWNRRSLLASRVHTQFIYNISAEVINNVVITSW